MALMHHLSLVSTMVHEMPRGRSRDHGPQIVYSNTPTPLNPDTDTFIREQMLEPSLAFGRQVIEASNNLSDVPQLARGILRDPLTLAANSKSIAAIMHSTQTGGASAGVFMASLAEQGGTSRLVIMKAEHQEGVRLRHSGEGDDIVFEVEHLTELIMGQNSRVYKIAMLWLDTNEKLVGLMVDKQNGVAFADYFLNEFLGCELTHRAEKLTEDFVKALSKFINSPSLSLEKRTRYATAVVALLESPADRLRPAQFISDYIDAEDRDELARSMPPQVQSLEFAKDTTLVRNQIGGLKLKMSSGDVTISATSEALENGTITFENSEAEGPRVVVKGTPEKLSLGKPPR